MATGTDGMVDVELTPEAQALIALLVTHALGAAYGALRALGDNGFEVTPKHFERIVTALRPREFCVAVLVLVNDPAFTNEQLIAAAREHGMQAVREAGPFPRATVN